MIPPSREECIAVARSLWGPENAALSTPREMRWGAKGSRKLDLERLLWHDFENDTRGGWRKLFQFAKIPLKNGHEDNFTPVAMYDYRDPQGHVRFQVVRLPGHRFYQRRPDGIGGWINDLHGVERILYRLPELLASHSDDLIFLTEGEKDADNVVRLGFIASTNPGGAGKWSESYNETLRGKHLVLLPDNDDVGRNHMSAVAVSLHGIAASIVTVHLPVGPKEDVSDWIARGGTGQQLYELATTIPLEPPPRIPPLKPGELALSFGAETLRPGVSTTVVRGLLYRRSVTLIYGPPKSGKSFLATNLALDIADDSRANWMGLPILAHGPVLYIACEGHAGFWKRLSAAAQHNGWLDESFPKNFILATGHPTLIRSDDMGRTFMPDPKAIVEALAVAAKRGLIPIAVFIDTVFRSFGSGNVNASDHMNAYLAAAAQVADQDIAVVLVHHEIKSGGTPAGSISLIGGSDTIVRVARDEDGQRSWEVEFAKDDVETDQVKFDLEVVEIGIDQDGLPASSCIVLGPDGEDAPAPAKNGRPKKHKLPPAAAVGERALEIAISKNGALLPPTDDYPSSTVAVGFELWRGEYYALKGGSPDSNRQAFNRAQDVLLARSIITQRGGYVWFAKRDS